MNSHVHGYIDNSRHCCSLMLCAAILWSASINKNHHRLCMLRRMHVGALSTIWAWCHGNRVAEAFATAVLCRHLLYQWLRLEAPSAVEMPCRGMSTPGTCSMSSTSWPSHGLSAATYSIRRTLPQIILSALSRRQAQLEHDSHIFDLTL